MKVGERDGCCLYGLGYRRGMDEMKLMGIVWPRLEWVGGSLIYLIKGLEILLPLSHRRRCKHIPLAQQCRDTSRPCLPPALEVSRYLAPGTYIYPGPIQRPPTRRLLRNDYPGPSGCRCGPLFQGASQTSGRGWLESSICSVAGPRQWQAQTRVATCEAASCVFSGDAVDTLWMRSR